MAKTTPKPIRKTVSFKYKNFDCYEYVKDIDNFSEYICRLIELDMKYKLLGNDIFELLEGHKLLNTLSRTSIVVDNKETSQPESKESNSVDSNKNANKNPGEESSIDFSNVPDKDISDLIDY